MVAHLRHFEVGYPCAVRCQQIEQAADGFRIASGFAEAFPRLARAFLAFLEPPGTVADAVEHFGRQFALVEVQQFADWWFRH